MINLLQSNNSQLCLTFLYWKPLGIVTSVQCLRLFTLPIELVAYVRRARSMLSVALMFLPLLLLKEVFYRLRTCEKHLLLEYKNGRYVTPQSASGSNVKDKRDNWKGGDGKVKASLSS